MEECRLIGRCLGVFRIMRDEQNGETMFLLELLYESNHLHLQAWPEGGERFIEQEQRLAPHEHAGERRPLPLPA